MIVTLADSLHIKTIAEGVEHLQQKDKLKELGCTFMQGFYFSKPMLPDEFTPEAVKTIHESV
jgi:EAL domain-containing protein (putative c-di-GMP-specific phosphodiesterase class I)